MPTFLAAGHETTSTQTTWTLFLLAQHPSVQDKLRAELAALAECSADPDAPDPDALSALPYLDAVFREAMRFARFIPAIGSMGSRASSGNVRTWRSARSWSADR